MGRDVFRVWLVGCALTLVLAGGCATTAGADRDGKPTEAAARELHAYYPLAVGNAWEYELDFRGQKVKKRIRIEAEKAGIFTDSEGARWQMDGRGLRDTGKRYVLRSPLALGTSWKAVASEVSVEEFEVVDVGARLETAAGRFDDCVTVRASNAVSEGVVQHAYMTYAPGVGLVQVRVEMVLNGTAPVPQSVIRLTGYDVAVSAAGAGGAGGGGAAGLARKSGGSLAMPAQKP